MLAESVEWAVKYTEWPSTHSLNQRRILDLHKHQPYHSPDHLHYCHPTDYPRIRGSLNSSLCVHLRSEPFIYMITPNDPRNPHPSHTNSSFLPRSALLMTSCLVIWFPPNSTRLLSSGLTTNVLTLYQWGRDMIWESAFQAHHTHLLSKRGSNTEESSLSFQKSFLPAFSGPLFMSSPKTWTKWWLTIHWH